jgi:hypothetical protein
MEISDRLSKLANYYHHEAERCARGQAYLGAAAMQVAAMEALLHAMCFLYPSARCSVITPVSKPLSSASTRPLDTNEDVGSTDLERQIPRGRPAFSDVA